MRCQQTGEKYKVKQMNKLQYNILGGRQGNIHVLVLAHLSKIQLQPFLFFLFFLLCVAIKYT